MLRDKFGNTNAFKKDLFLVNRKGEMLNPKAEVRLSE